MLATGGFGGNKDMMDEMGVISHKFCSNHIGAENAHGDGIRIQEDAAFHIGVDEHALPLLLGRARIVLAEQQAVLRPLGAIDQGPFYAAKLAGWLLSTLSGVRVDNTYTPLTAEGERIEGLKCVGLDHGGFFNGMYAQ